MPWNIELEHRGTRETSRHVFSPIVAWSQEQGKAPNRTWGHKKRDLQQESLPSASTKKETILGVHNPSAIGVLLFHNLRNPCAIQQSSHNVCSQVATRFTGSASKLRSILPLDRSQPSNGKVRLSKIFAILMQSKNLHTFGEQTCRGILNKETDGTYIAVLDSQADRWRRTTTMLDDRVTWHRNEPYRQASMIKTTTEPKATKVFQLSLAIQ